MEEVEFEEMPTLQCNPEECNSCTARFKAVCRTATEPGECEWDGDTQPTGPKFLEGFDDDYIVDAELGGESG